MKLPWDRLSFMFLFSAVLFTIGDAVMLWHYGKALRDTHEKIEQLIGNAIGGRTTCEEFEILYPGKYEVCNNKLELIKK